MHKFPSRKREVICLLILCIAVTAVYAPTFSGDFLLDDRHLLEDNLFIREFKSPASYLSQEDGVGKEVPRGHHTGYYRPLVPLLYTLEYKIWGMRAVGFRVTNLILHLATCIILYFWLAKLFGDPFISFLAALLFALHPVNTESVAWISSRNNILVTLFSLISFLFYLKTGNKGRIWAEVLSCLSFSAALLCKEFAIVLLPVFFLYNRFMRSDRLDVRAEVLGFIPFLLILFFYFALRAHAIGSVLTPLSTPSLWKSIYFVPFLIIYNLKLILIPYGLHSFIIHYPDVYLTWKAIAGFLGLALLFLFLWKARGNKILLFSIVSFLAALFPVLNIIHTSAVTLVSMRWLYFPMTFLSVSLAWYLQKWLRIRRPLVMCIIAFAAIYLGTYSHLLNRNLWQNEDAFYEQEVLHYDNYFYVGGMAERLFVKKKFTEAERYFQKAIHLYPHELRNYLNYVALLVHTDRAGEALICLDRAKALIKTNFEEGQWYNNRGMAYFRLGKKDKALADFLKAVAYWPHEAQFWSNLGGAYGTLGDYRNSISSLEKGLEIDPDSVDLRKNLAVSWIKVGNYGKAIEILERISVEERKKSEEISTLLGRARRELLSNKTDSRGERYVK
jgi:tetratricopeptide (TPR) repeat protein